MSTAPMPNEIEMEGRVPIFQAPEFEGSPAVVPVHPMQQVPVHPNHQASIYGMQQVPVNQIQNPIPIQPAAFPRVQFKTRWMYGYFAIAAGLYHVIWTILWGLILALPNHLYWTLAFLVLGFIPSLMTVILIIMDSTVLCCGLGNDAYRIKIRRHIVAIPLGIAALLRILLYIIIFGQWAHFLNDYESKNFIDDVFWIIMAFGAFDAGPMILLAVDWWYYYSEPTRNGIFGTKTNPMRCVVGQSTLLFVVSWSFVALVNEYAPVHEVAEFMWPWLVHGVISAAALIFCAITQCSGTFHPQFSSLSNIH